MLGERWVVPRGQLLARLNAGRRGFNPISYFGADLVAYFDAATPGGTPDDDGDPTPLHGTFVETVPGTPRVDELFDRAGGASALQATDARRPVISATGGLSIAGAGGQFLLASHSGAATALASADWTIMVAHDSSQAANKVLGGITKGNARVHMFRSATGGIQCWVRDASLNLAQTTAAGASGQQVGFAWRTGGNLYAQVGKGSPATPASTAALSALDFSGSPFGLLNDGVALGGNEATAEVVDIMIFQRALSDEERDQLVDYETPRFPV